jgi:hypothetical protein
VEPASTPRPLVQKKTWRDSLPIDMLLSAASVLVVAQSSSEIPEGLMNNPALYDSLESRNKYILRCLKHHTCKWTTNDDILQKLLHGFETLTDTIKYHPVVNEEVRRYRRAASVV